ncbi:hypothetical protein [Cystobacter ferrugineus]|uniref:Lipoprotein n=1 Tax=Cystobacter ferrugineus TaxID=83449 RepID=A0A1L9BES8_9BACT|nr:hypothetical protein [Cystobacter ferrugineus]OJH40777.1 hypothetical protein BON30_07495 [Cystobacter ferrugineus]
MRTSSSFLLILLAAPVTACHRDIPSLNPPPAAAPPLRPLFLPPDDSLLTETVRTSLRHEGTPDAREAEMTTVSRFSAEQDSWVLTQRVTRSRYLQGGQPMESLVDTVLQRAVLRLRLAADGTYVRLVEPEAVLAAIREVAPRELDVTPLERFFAPDALEARTRGEWEVKYGGIYGRAWVPGQRGYAVGVLPVGGREVTYLLERTFTGTQLTEQGEALVFSLRCLAQPGDVSPQAVRDTLRLAGDPQVTPGVECDGEQLLGKGRFLPVRRGFTLRASLDGETWTWATQSTLESVRALEEEQR